MFKFNFIIPYGENIKLFSIYFYDSKIISSLYYVFVLFYLKMQNKWNFTLFYVVFIIFLTTQRCVIVVMLKIYFFILFIIYILDASKSDKHTIVCVFWCVLVHILSPFVLVQCVFVFVFFHLCHSHKSPEALYSLGMAAVPLAASVIQPWLMGKNICILILKSHIRFSFYTI